MRVLTLFAAFALSATSALAAEEPSGCDKFKWPIERERAALTAPDRAKLASGAEQAALPASAITLSLVAPADAKLPTPPERAPKDGHFLKPVAFSGATDCDGIRKTMKYQLSAQPLTLQVSGAKDNSLSIAILPAQ